MRNNLLVEHYKKHKKVPKLISFADEFDTAFNKAPEEAMKWLKERGKNIITTGMSNTVDAETHDRAFTVANVMKADIIQTIFNRLEYSIENGKPLKHFQDNLMNDLEGSGWTGSNPSRLKVIFETNRNIAFSKGQYFKLKTTSDIYPYWKWNQIERPTKRHDHSKLHGKVFRHDDPFWNSNFPPNGYGCKCSVVPITEAEAKAIGISKFEDFKDELIEEPTIKPLEAWEPQFDKYHIKLQKELKQVIDKQKEVASITNIENVQIFDIGNATNIQQIISILEWKYGIKTNFPANTTLEKAKLLAKELIGGLKTTD